MITLLAMPQDRARADAVVDALVAADLPVWAETAEPGGPAWGDALARSDDSRCLIVCWSGAAFAADDAAKAFRAAAREGCAQGKAIGVLFEHVAPPADFACTLYDLSGWRTAPHGWRKWLIGDAHLRDVVAAAKSKQANRDPPPPSAPTKLLVRQIAVLSSAIIVPLIALLSLTDVLLNFYGRMADRPSASEQAAWDGLPAGDCAALRAFVRDFRDGAYRDQADALLGAAERIERTEWRSAVLDEEIYLPHSAGTRQADAEAEGARRCEMLVQGTGARNLRTSISRVRQDCGTIGSERLCDWRGTVRCSFEQPHQVPTETCNR